MMGSFVCIECGVSKTAQSYYGPYPNGHTRYLSCIDCCNRRRRARWKSDTGYRENILAEQRKQWKLNPERSRVNTVRLRVWQQTHKDRVRIKNEKWRKNNKARRVIIQQRYRGRRISAGNGITSEQWLQMCSENAGLCSYCGKVGRLVIEHVVPLVRSGKNDIDNIVPSCVTCNSRKNALSLLAFMYRARYAVS